ncbi:hypothetical protein PENTCL1PPCAC_2003, partial [Pristionchus entomophagus]
LNRPRMAWIQNLKNWERLPESAEYMKKVYGDPLAYLNADQSKFVTEREYFGDFGYGECFNSTSTEVQCELITGEFDPTQLPYEKRLAWHFKEFCYKTSAHGIPMIGQAPNRYYRGVWILLFIGCMSMLYYNADSVLDKYNRNEKIVDIQLKFDTAPFPAITLCNLNPYKASLASNVALVQRTLNAFRDAMPSDKKGGGDEDEDEDDSHHRMRRSAKDAYFEPGHSKCLCGKTSSEQEGTEKTTTELPDDIMDEWEEDEDEETSTAKAASDDDCDGDKHKYDTPDSDEHRCICAFDRGTQDAWPCHPPTDWKNTSCLACNEHAFCREHPPAGETALHPPRICLCASTGFCIAYNDKAPMIEIWKFLSGGPTTEDPNFLEAMGFAGMTDEVAIVNKAKENIMFAMATLSMGERQGLSTTKRELIHKCSFNGMACDIDGDFMTHVDPVFGNCFTFNYNRTVNLTSIRAGPMYGLRMLVYVNASDYMPTTEATGVRLTIHDKEDFPFPDTFGYSAPTGYVSSFGLRLRKMSRLPAPYGDCIPDGKGTDYIYDNYEYSVEGCYRSCFQQL